ncbi:WecB/TagA/CpsF family glycosyltransferase [Microbulbifer bruguierae]|uniref:WecB/TagA/CpsF family glycosyltransferase n=1 Tax=Microbulbifer bruguierae TaxID=3029061 RepID=A0ABY8N8M9_9GAMM|nr:WecB/TagA/CpsF family glycosyltransferase [Microbulbifer bruguierae]WGL15255.1 WecB/TagA/CpsF family glycosyltransferase [Microbulbifer bruguierae]
MGHDHSSLDIGLCRIDLASMDEVRSTIRAMRKTNSPGYVVTPNIDHLVRLSGSKEEEDLKSLYYSATLSLCDSRILELMLKRHGFNIPEVVTGSDLTAKLFERDLGADDYVYILGGEDSLIVEIRQRFPEITIEHHNPTMGFIKKNAEVGQVVDLIVAKKPNYVFLAVGSPQQEIIAKKLCDQPEFKGIALCVGASMLFLAGAEKRAPGWIQKARLEWLYRLSQNPSRLAIRYLKNALAIPAINREMMSRLGP